MNFGYDSLIGISAAFLTTLSFFPQIVKTYRTRRVKDVHDDLVIIGANVVKVNLTVLLHFYIFYQSKTFTR
jgi:hypothetical protein